MIRPRSGKASASALKEGDVIGRIVGDKDAASCKVKECWKGHSQRGCIAQHCIGDSRQHGNERRDWNTRVNQSLELADDLTAANFNRANLGDSGVARGSAGCFKVDDNKRDIGQRSAEVVESCLMSHIHDRRHRV